MNRTIETEINSARESVDLIFRRPNYAENVIGLYALSFYGITRSRIMRASYLPVRKADDALDGDAPRIKNPLSYVGNLRYNIAKNTLGKSPEERLLQYSLNALESKAKTGDDPRGDFVRSMDSIIYDYVRSSERRILSAKEIEQYYREAFDPVMNITLLAIDSTLRSGDIPSLSYGQGRVYSARHFKEDWERGVLNVPGETISLLNLSSRSSFEEVGGNPGITDFFHQSLLNTRPDLLEAQFLLKLSGEKQTQAVCNSLISPMLKYIEAH